MPPQPVHRIRIEAALRVVDRLGFHVRDTGLLDSALERPVARAFGRSVYPTDSLAAAAQTESLACNRPLIDGNKRLSLVLLSVFLRLHGCRHTMPPRTAYDLVMHVAQRELDIQGSAEILAAHLVPW